VEPAAAAPAVSSPQHPTRWRAIASFLVVAMMAAGAFAWVRAHTPPSTPAALGLQGRLVYAVADGPGWSRLWVWDLETNRATWGPRVREVAELVNAYGAGPGWIGVTSRLGGGGFVAGVLRYLDPTDQATPLLTADLIAWGARGEGVAGVRHDERTDCGRLQVLYAGLVAPTGTEVRVDRADCREVLSLGRDSLRTYLTLFRRRRARVVFAGLDRFHPLLAGYALSSTSPNADLLVVRVGHLPPLPILERDAGDPNGPPSALYGTGLFFQGLTGGTPIHFGTAGHAFRLNQVLGWSPDASLALVTGRAGDQYGLFELDAGPSPGRRTPRFLGMIDGAVFGTFADDGTGFLANGESLNVLQGGSLVELGLPSGAPPPGGPIVWIR
jgi:hypothetical protein